MKKQTIYAIVLLCATAFCGCYSTQRVVSYRALDHAVNSVAEEMEKAGFTLVDVQHSNKQEPSLSSRSHAIDNVPSIQSAGEVMQTSSPSHGFQGSWSRDCIIAPLSPKKAETCEDRYPKHPQQVSGRVRTQVLCSGNSPLQCIQRGLKESDYPWLPAKLSSC